MSAGAQSPLIGAIGVGILGGIFYGCGKLKADLRLCDNKAYRDLNNRKNDIEQKINFFQKLCLILY